MAQMVKSFTAACLIAAASLTATVPAAADAVKDWQTELVKKLRKSHIYPRSAIRREIEGRALVSITIDRSGEVTGFEVVESAGNDVLDKTIPKMVERLNPLPEPPEALADSNLTFTVPFTWRLQ